MENPNKKKNLILNNILFDINNNDNRDILPIKCIIIVKAKQNDREKK